MMHVYYSKERRVGSLKHLSVKTKKILIKKTWALPTTIKQITQIYPCHITIYCMIYMYDTIYLTQTQKYYYTNYKPLNEMQLSAERSLDGFTEVIGNYSQNCTNLFHRRLG